MDFVGTGLKLTDRGLASAAQSLGCETAALAAVIDVEAAGHGFDGSNRPKALFEPHVFYRNLKSPARDRAVVAGLAYPKWRPGNYPHTSDGVYAQIAKACAIDEEAALKASSWGLGQVLGEDAVDAGYPSASAMVESFKLGEDEQLSGVVGLMRRKGLGPEMARRDWAGVARGWNGPNYAANHYNTKLAAAYERRAGIPVTQGLPAPTVLTTPDVASMGQHSAVVSDIQDRLSSAGLAVGTDGDYGTETRDAVSAFQKLHDLPVTGRVDPTTWAELMKLPARTPVSADRANATASDLKANGSQIVAKGSLITKLSGGAAAAIAGIQSGALGAAAKGVSDLSSTVSDTATKAKDVADNVQTASANVQAAADSAHQAATTAHGLIALAGQYWWIAVVGVLIVVAIWGAEVVKARVEDHRTGKTL